MVDLGYGPTGKRLRRSVYAKTETEARHRLKALVRQKDDGTISTAKRQTVSQFLGSWLEDAARPSVRPLTFARYERTVKVHLPPALGRIQLDRLSGQDVQRLLNEKATTLSPQTVHDIRAVLRTALAQAIKWNLVSRNAASMAKPPRIPQRLGKFLTPPQARALLDAVALEPRLEALVTVALSLGLREGEALGLR